MKTKILKFITIPKLLAFIALLLLVVLSSIKPLVAQQVIRGYAADSDLERGMIVRLKADNSDVIEPLKQSESSEMHGVVVAPNDSPLTLSTDDQKIFAASSGRFDVLVSTQNGPINAGDYITISSNDGIGMKADDQSGYVVGKALDSFNSGSSISGTTQVNGQTVEYGRVLAEIAIGPNPLLRTSGPAIPGFLQASAEAISGKPVSTLRTYLAALILLAAMVIAGSLLYGGIKSSITAVGRNPLSRSSINSSLMKVLFTGIMIFLSGVIAVYLLLKL